MTKHGRRTIQNRSDPAGAQWQSVRREVFRQQGLTCYHCGHPCRPGLATVQHLLSPRTHPQLSYSLSNLRVAHSGGQRRCPVCDLDCQAISASNTAPRDERGRPLPFPPEYLRQKIAERRARVASGQAQRRPRKPAGSAAKPAEAKPSPRIFPNAGRAW